MSEFTASQNTRQLIKCDQTNILRTSIPWLACMDGWYWDEKLCNHNEWMNVHLISDGVERRVALFYPENNTLDFQCHGCQVIVWAGKFDMVWVYSLFYEHHMFRYKVAIISVVISINIDMNIIISHFSILHRLFLITINIIATYPALVTCLRFYIHFCLLIVLEISYPYFRCSKFITWLTFAKGLC